MISVNSRPGLEEVRGFKVIEDRCPKIEIFRPLIRTRRIFSIVHLAIGPQLRRKLKSIWAFSQASIWRAASAHGKRLAAIGRRLTGKQKRVTAYSDAAAVRIELDHYIVSLD